MTQTLLTRTCMTADPRAAATVIYGDYSLYSKDMQDHRKSIGGWLVPAYYLLQKNK